MSDSASPVRSTNGGPPPLPARNTPTSPLSLISHQTPQSVSSVPPSLPPKDFPVANGHKALVDSDLAPVLIARQFEVYSSSLLKESSDYLTIVKNHNDELLDRYTKLQFQNETNDNIVLGDFWHTVVKDLNSFITENKTGYLEKTFSHGIPSLLRPIIYQSVLQIGAKITDEKFTSLCKSGEEPSNNSNLYEKLKLDGRIIRIVNALACYENGTILKEESPAFPNMIIGASKSLSQIPDFEDTELFVVLLKMSRMFQKLSKNEFVYKINRSFEEELSDVFLHLTRQGINLNMLYKLFLDNFFNEQIKDYTITLKLLDLILIEGPDFLIRFLLLIFSVNSGALLNLSNEELLKYLTNGDLFEFINKGKFDLSGVFDFNPNIIKYENEYHLIHSNSLNLNDTELTNLKGVNEELTSKTAELNTDFETLNNSHLQILEENSSIRTKLIQVSNKNRKLHEVKEDLLLKIKTLDMHEEISYTVKRNEEIEAMNQDFQSQIDELKQTLAVNKEKLDKFISAASPSPIPATPKVPAQEIEVESIIEPIEEISETAPLSGETKD